MSVEPGRTERAAPELELIYVGDAMCSWCWGFAPTIEAVQAASGLPVRLINGGLRPGPSAEAMSPSMVRFLEGCWTQVHAASGAEFDHAGLNKPDGWRYNTLGPACAVVTLRERRPEHTLAFYHRLQRAFYAEAVDITDPQTWPELVAPFDPDPTDFLAQATSDSAQRAAYADFAQAREWGISGFPALIARHGSELALITRGWQPPEPIVEAVTRWKASLGLPAADSMVDAPPLRAPGAAAAGEHCDVETGSC